MLAGDTATGADQAQTKGTGQKPEPAKQPEHDEPEPTPYEKETDSPEEPDDLGDAGKRAIERMKTERTNAIRALKKTESALAQRDAELAEAKQTIRQLRIEKFAAGKLREPSLALKLLTDLNGDEDDKAIMKAIDGLISDHPYLAPENETQDKERADESARLASLFPDGSLKPADQHTANAAQFGAVLDQLGISIQ